MRTYRKRRGVKSRKTKKQHGVRRGKKRTQIRGGNYDKRRRELELQVTNMELIDEIKKQFQNYFKLCSEYQNLIDNKSESNKIKTKLLNMETIIENYLNTTHDINDINDINKEILLEILENYPCFEKD